MDNNLSNQETMEELRKILVKTLTEALKYAMTETLKELKEALMAPSVIAEIRQAIVTDYQEKEKKNTEEQHQQDEHKSNCSTLQNSGQVMEAMTSLLTRTNPSFYLQRGQFFHSMETQPEHISTIRKVILRLIKIRSFYTAVNYCQFY